MLLEAILEERKISKAALASMIGAQRQNINSLLTNPKLSTLEKISSALNIPMWQLFATKEEIVGNGLKMKCPKCQEIINIDIKLS